MTSFSRVSTFSAAYFRAYTSWLLRNRRDVNARVSVINARLKKIGEVTVFYERVEQGDGGIRANEKRIGFSVTPNTTLEALVRAYIARGGNPLDISSFMHPDRTEILENGARAEMYPQGGVAAPKSVDYNNPVDEPDDTGYGSYRGGYISLEGYHPARLGGRLNRGGREDDVVVNMMTYTSRWAQKEIKALQMLEWKIIKQCDLREQLIQERDDILAQAFGGTLASLDSEFSDERFVRSHLVQNLIQDMYETVYNVFQDGEVVNYSPRGDVALLEFVLEDVDSEAFRDPLGC